MSTFAYKPVLGQTNCGLRSDSLIVGRRVFVAKVVRHTLIGNGSLFN